MIVAFGCSFTFGEELDDLPEWYGDMDDKRNFMPHKEVYDTPSKKSYPSIMGDLLKCDVENYGWRGGSNDRIFRKFFDNILLNDNPSTYVVQWTFPHRTEIYSTKNGYYEGIVPVNVSWHEDSKIFYERYFDENEEKDKLIRYIWTIHSVCKELGHKLIQFFPISVEELILLKARVGEKGLPDTFIDDDEIIKKVDNMVHPTEDGHKKLAEYLIGRL